MLQSFPDRQRGTATGTVVLVITFMMIAFVTAITIAVYMFSPGPGN